MPMPMTRPINHSQMVHVPGTLTRPSSTAGLTLPPSHGTTLPAGAGTLHTVKNPGHQIPTTSRVVPARVS